MNSRTRLLVLACFLILAPNSPAAGQQPNSCNLPRFSEDTAALKPTAEEGVRVLESMKPGAKDDTEKLNVQRALLDGYAALGRYDKTEEITAELAKDHPDSRRVFLARVYALRVLGRAADADQLAKNWQTTQPDDLTGARMLVYNAAYREDYPLAYELAKKY